jgi:hypothetical protein
MEFEQWWIINKNLYTIVGVKENVAKAIWDDATFATEGKMYKQVTQILQEHE